MLPMTNQFLATTIYLDQSPVEQESNPAGETGSRMDPVMARKALDPKDSTVLVVEDNVSNFVLIARMLGYMGIHCEWKTSGYEVVEYADTLPRLDLILMDLRLPYEDGYAALKKIRASHHLQDTPVVAVTAESSMEQLKKAREANFNGFIGKPLDPDRFPDQIRRILSGEPVWELG
jgi:two-component system cell cycle response regulator DivK